jgi:acetolactate synthase regulatory subunit
MYEPSRRYAFLIEAQDAPDVLVRVLTLFAVQPLTLAQVAMTARNGDCTIRVEADGLSAQRAEVLLQRLQGLAIVRSVGLARRGLAALAG